MDKKARALLCDVIELFSKHDIEAFELLVREIKSENIIESILLILQRLGGEATPRVAEDPASKSRRTRERPIHMMLEEIAEKDEEKGRLLLSFREDLAAGAHLPTLRDVRDFVERSGLKPARATSRSGAISALLRDLSSLPIDRVRSLLHDARQMELPSDRSLARWSELILEGTGRGSERVSRARTEKTEGGESNQH